jgi:hypothetical protein
MSETPVLPIIDLSAEDFPFTQPDPIPIIPPMEKICRKRSVEEVDFLIEDLPDLKKTKPESPHLPCNEDLLKKIQELFEEIDCLQHVYFQNGGDNDSFVDILGNYSHLFE